LSDRWSVSEVAATFPFREVVESDADRGVVLFDATLRQVYANATAKRQMHEADGAVLPGLRDALIAFRDRLDRGEALLGSGEHPLASSPSRSVRATLAAVRGVGGRWFVVRLTSTNGAAEPNLRRLQARFRFTPREAEVALDVSKGLSNAEAAQHLGVTEKTVKNVLMQVFTKAGVRNRVELSLRAHDADVGLPSPRPD